MTKQEAVKGFKETFIGLYINHADYWKAQEAWTFYVDDLNKTGCITDKQAATWSTLFPYGKPLEPSRKQLERVVMRNEYWQ